MKTKMCVTSLISYYNILGTLSKREKEVLLCLKQLGIANNMMISKSMFVPLSSVCGRMNSLRKKGIVIYHHSGACPYTRETTRFFKIKSYISEVME